MTKIQAMKAMEANGLGFTANVIMNGCGKPTKKMSTILDLIADGADVRHAQFNCYTLLVDGNEISLGQLDYGYMQVRLDILAKRGQS